MDPRLREDDDAPVIPAKAGIHINTKMLNLIQHDGRVARALLPQARLSKYAQMTASMH